MNLLFIQHHLGITLAIKIAFYYFAYFILKLTGFGIRLIQQAYGEGDAILWFLIYEPRE